MRLLIQPLFGTFLFVSLMWVTTSFVMEDRETNFLFKTSFLVNGSTEQNQAEVEYKPVSIAAGVVEKILKRPLFEESRRPIIVEAQTRKEIPAVKPPPETLINFRILGIFKKGKSQKVLVSNRGNPAEWLEIGQAVDGWSVHTIEKKIVGFTKGNQLREFILNSVPE